MYIHKENVKLAIADGATVYKGQRGINSNIQNRLYLETRRPEPAALVQEVSDEPHQRSKCYLPRLFCPHLPTRAENN